jgi:hypothetical protein
MPVRSLNSCVLVWPSPDAVLAAALRYAEQLVATDGRVVLSHCETPFLLRPLELPAPRLPVPADLVVLTEGEVANWSAERPRWSREVLQRAIVLAERERSGLLQAKPDRQT